MTKITIEELECKACGYKWFPRDINRIPNQCPRCKIYRYNIERKKSSGGRVTLKKENETTTENTTPSITPTKPIKPKKQKPKIDWNELAEKTK